MSALQQRLIDLAEKTGRELRIVHTRIDGDLATVEKASLPAAISEVAGRLTVNISVGATPPASPSLNDLWVDTA